MTYNYKTYNSCSTLLICSVTVVGLMQNNYLQRNFLKTIWEETSVKATGASGNDAMLLIHKIF